MKQPISNPKLTTQETQLIERLRQHPEMLDRVQSILDLVHASDGPLKSADEVEELLIQELRQLGHSTMTELATEAEARDGDELQCQDVTGAEWIPLQSREVFGEQGHFLCDFFHVSEYLGAAATVCRPGPIQINGDGRNSIDSRVRQCPR